MSALHVDSQSASRDGGPVDARSYASAILNILEDAAGEKTRLEATQKAVLNILDDSAEEAARLADTQRAALNILEDFDMERAKAEAASESLRLAKDVAETANIELNAFSYSVAHDLRAPLRSIDGFSQALLEDYQHKLDAQGVDYLQRIRLASQFMGHLIEGMLRLSRLTRAEIRHQNVNLTAMARTIAGTLRTRQPERQVNFVIADGLVTQGDPVLLQVVLENLLDNAWKYTAKHPMATVEFGSTHQGGSPAYFVRDDGAGFDMAYADKLFGAFQRLHRRNEFEGIGIGLATVQRIINRHGGRVWAEGVVEHGATFHFTLQPERSSP